MIDPLAVSIGTGLFVSLVFSELFGLAAGGLVVPGYIALELDRPLSVILTLVAAVATTSIVHVLSLVTILYGKRRTVLTILIGYLIGMAANLLALQSFGPADLPRGEVAIIGFIIPGLIAIWIERQGMVQTISSLLTASVVVRLILILVYGKALNL